MMKIERYKTSSKVVSVTRTAMSVDRVPVFDS